MAGEEILIYLLAAVFGEFGVIILFMTKTPAVKWLVAAFTKRQILIHPRENRYMHFIPAKSRGELATVKDRGLYNINPKHTYIEPQSKVPCTIVYGSHGISIDPKMADVATRLKIMGIRDLEALDKYLKTVQTPEGERKVLEIFGESVDIADIVDYFQFSERSDVAEAEIQRRTAAEIAQKPQKGGDIMKWAVIMFIVMVGAGVLYTMVMNAVPAGNAQTQAPSGGAPPTNWVTQAGSALGVNAGTTGGTTHTVDQTGGTTETVNG